MSEPTNRDEDLTRVEATTSSGTPHSSLSNADSASPPMPLIDPSSPMDVGLAAAFALSNSTEVRPPVASPVVAGQLIGGKYKLIQAIGEGGMGTVWLAEQKEPVKRKVAVKLVKTGIDLRQVLARFEAERQALALMDHPNIAKVLDGGATEQARPYFVMELVKGVPLTEYCDQVQFSIRQRLELFGQVCSAVQHAHQKGIIHRDLKPSNVLVTEQDGRPVVKVIDFGLAKALHGSQVLTDLSMHTAFGAVLGTPLYMAPEQLGTSALDVDTRADLYSLGVILYELLTGTTPIERKQLKQAAFEEMCRLIREQDPPSPSTRLSSSDALPSVAARRHVEPAQLTRLVRGELDWIIMKTLEKDRNRRYETANGLALDIQRYLAGEVVHAAPPSLTYRLTKLVLRNRVMVVAGSLVAVAIIAGFTATSIAMLRARMAERLANERLAEALAARAEEAKQRERAEEQRELAESSRGEALRNLDFARRSIDGLAAIFVSLDPREEYESVAELREAILQNVDQAAEKILDLEIGDSRVAAELQNSLGTSLFSLGAYPQAIKLLQTSLETYTLQFGNDHIETLTVALNLAESLHQAGELEQARSLYEKSLETMTNRLGPNDRMTLTCGHNLAVCLGDLGARSEAMNLLDDVLARRKSEFGADDEDTLATLNNLAVFYFEERRFEKLVSMMEEIVAGYQAQLGDKHRDTLIAKSNLAMALQADGRLEPAISLTQETVETMRIVLGATHPTTLHTLNNLGGMFWSTRQYEKAIVIYRELLPIHREKWGANHRQTQMTVSNLGMNYLDSGQFDQAIPLLEEAYQANIAPTEVDVIGKLRRAYLGAGRREKFATLTHDYLADKRGTMADAEWIDVLVAIAEEYRQIELWPQAIDALREALGVATKSVDAPGKIGQVQTRLGLAILDSVRQMDDSDVKKASLTEAETLLVEAYQRMSSEPAPEGRDPLPTWEAILHALIRLTELRDDPQAQQKWQLKLESLRTIRGD